jgi:hypothetical protein
VADAVFLDELADEVLLELIHNRVVLEVWDVSSLQGVRPDGVMRFSYDRTRLERGLPPPPEAAGFHT